MKLSFNSKYNIAYLSFRKKIARVQTIKINDALNIDMTPDGTIYGIELLNANEQLKSAELNKFEIINELNGKKVDIPINI